MKRSQVNRARIAERAAERAGATRSTRRPSTVGTNPAMRMLTVVEQGGNIGRQFGTGSRGGSGHAGYRSEWAMTTDAPFGGWH